MVFVMTDFNCVTSSWMDDCSLASVCVSMGFDFDCCVSKSMMLRSDSGFDSDESNAVNFSLINFSLRSFIESYGENGV